MVVYLFQFIYSMEVVLTAGLSSMVILLFIIYRFDEIMAVF